MWKKFIAFILTILGVGIVWAAVMPEDDSTEPLIMEEYEVLEVMDKGKIIRLSYTDDNTNEDIIIHNDKEIYSGITGVDIYISVENKSVSQNINLQTFFSDSDIEIASIFRVEEVCKTATTTICSNQWIEKDLTDYSESENEILTADVAVKSKGTHRAKRKTTFFLAKNEIAYFKAQIEFSLLEGEEEEIFFETVGHKKGYGHLDPTILSDYLREDWNYADQAALGAVWNDGDTNGGVSSISPPGQLYLDGRSMSAAGQIRRSYDFGTIGSGDYYFQMRFKGDKWDKLSTSFVGLLGATHAATNRLDFMIGNGHTGGDGIWVRPNGGFVKAFTKTWEDNIWYTITFFVHTSQTDVNIWIDKDPSEAADVTDADVSRATGIDGIVIIQGYASVAGDGEYHIDYFYVGTAITDERRVIIIN